jgi:Xaa-Pro aminopeptidase
MNSPIPARLSQLRNAMKNHGIDAYYIPSADPHLSEYLPEHWQGREYFSGFTGSVANLVVTQTFAGLWVDSRYWEQAEHELHNTGIELMKVNSAAASLHFDWLAENLKVGQIIAVDGDVLSLAAERSLRSNLEKKGVHLNTELDVLNPIWIDRPALPSAPIYEHSAPFAPLSRTKKLQQVRVAMQAHGVQHHFISSLDDIAWLLNLRGSDVNYNPVFLAHALIELESATLFCDPKKLTAELIERLAQEGVTVQAYAFAKNALQKLPPQSGLLIDPRRVTFGFKQQVPTQVNIIEAINPCVLLKAIKSPEEAAFVRTAMEQDGAALCEFFAWLEQAQKNQEAITELTIDEQICAARARQAHYVCPSFGTIAGFNGNGAMPHYRATQQSHATIQGDGLLLIDSGGQYLNGTTDITRVVAIGALNEQQKIDCSLVLKGVIALSKVRFPKGTYSSVLDTLARAPMWSHGINYGHGTGHGVGYFMNVHEGPQSISVAAIPDVNTVMQLGMITSNEPGIYRPGKWGVRIENLLLCVPSIHSEFAQFLEFETLTLCPIDRRCIAWSNMTAEEIAWVNDYHQIVRTRLQDRVQGMALAWLLENTQAINQVN